MSENDKKSDEILEVVLFLKEQIIDVQEHMVTKEDLSGLEIELKRDIHGLGNRLDDELGKRKVLEMRVKRLETRQS